jgi:hypothetical protein
MDTTPTDTVDTQATWLALDREQVVHIAQQINGAIADELEYLLKQKVIESDLEATFYTFASLALSLSTLLNENKEYAEQNLDLFISLAKTELS